MWSMSWTGQMTGFKPWMPRKAVERLLLICFLLSSRLASNVCGPVLSTGLTIQSENLRPMEMVGLGRQQKCSGAQNSLQQLVKERLRGLVESWRGEVSLDPPEIGSTSQQEEGACEYGWSAALLAHKAVSLTALLAAAALTFLGFWDLRLLLEMMLWPWRVCMAVVRWIYSSLDERRMSQRRHVAEMALRSAMKSGDVDALSQALDEAETARVDVPVKRRGAAQLRDLRRRLARVQKKLRTGQEPRRASSSPRRNSSRSTSPSPQSSQPEEHSATGSASELHGDAQQAGWQGQKEGIAPLQNGVRSGSSQQPRPEWNATMAHGHDKGALSSGPSRQPSRTLSMQSSYSEPSGQEALAAPSNLLKRDRDRDRDRERDRDRAALGMGSEPQLQRDSASQVELAAQAVEAREAEKERLRQEKEISRRERAHAKLLQQQQQTQAPVACESQQERAALQAPASGTPKANGVRGSSFFGSGRPQAVPNGAASEPRTHYRAPRKAVPISLVSDSTTPRGGKRGPSTLCVPRNQAHVNGGSGLAQNGEGGPGAKAGTPKLAGGPFGGTGGDSGMTWSPSSAPTTPSGKGDMVSGLPFSQGFKASQALNGFGDGVHAQPPPPPPPPKTWAQAARGKTQGDRPMSADSRPATAPEHAVAPQSARSGSLNALFRSPAASPAPQAQGPSFMGSSLYSGEGLGFRFPGGVSQGASGSLSPFPGMTANRMAAPISRPPPLSQMGGWSGVDDVLPSLGLPAFSGGGTMMSMPQAAPSAYPGLQGLWGPVTQPPPTGSSPPGWTPWRLMPPSSNCDPVVPPSASPRDPLTSGVKGELSEESSVPSGSRFSTLSASSSLETCT